MNNELFRHFCKAIRESTFKRLKIVLEGYQNWRISKVALTFIEIVKHLIELDDWTIHKINDPTIKLILPKKWIFEDCSKEHFKDLIRKLDKSLKRKIKFIRSLSEEQIKSKIFDDRFNYEVSVEWFF